MAEESIANIPCKGCWWEEGGRCYVEPCERVRTEFESGGSAMLSIKPAAGRCESFESKRAVFEQYIPRDRLVILSELTGRGEKPPVRTPVQEVDREA